MKTKDKIKMSIATKMVLLICLVFGVLFTSCEGDLAELNVNPNASPDLPYDAQLLRVQLGISGFIPIAQRTAGFQGNAIQQTASLEVGGLNYGDKYVDGGAQQGQDYQNIYGDAVKNVVDLVSRSAEDPEDVNYHNIARILRAFIFHRITDAYGDVPYSEAGLALTGNVTPVFDTQESIYRDMLSQLQSAAEALDPGKPTYDGSDQYYSGDIGQWKKLAYSLILRLAMRLQKVDPASAQQWANTAVSGGVFTSNDDNMVMKHAIGNDQNHNPYSRFAVDNGNRFRLSKTLIDMLTNTGDPRLEIYAQSYDGVTTPIKGLPNGLDANTLGSEDYNTFAYWNANLIGSLDAPVINLTYSEVALLQAEAVTRGWISGDATALYEAGVAAGMTQWNVFPEVVVPDQTAIDTYLANNPFDGSLEMIGNQIWLTNYMNYFEAFSSWRRTGFPVLTPVDYPGNLTGGTIPRRRLYGISDRDLNTENYNAAVARQGPDELTTRVWWDAN